MADLSSPFKTTQGEAEYLAAYEATMRLWSVPHESMDLRDRFGSTHVEAAGDRGPPQLVALHCFFTSLTSWVDKVPELSRHFRL